MMGIMLNANLSFIVSMMITLKGRRVNYRSLEEILAKENSLKINLQLINSKGWPLWTKKDLGIWEYSV